MKKPLIKICGLTEPSDARHAVLAGADLVGLNFHPYSVRAVDFSTANCIANVARTTHNPRRRGFKPAVVAVFVNPPSELVEAVVDEVSPDLLQFHGDETVEDCLRYNHPFIKGVRLADHASVDSIADYITPLSKTFLVDAHSAKRYGGTGKRISMGLAERALQKGPGFLAGGLNPANVAEAIRALCPYGVDVASGVEVRPGQKSERLMYEFVQAVMTAHSIPG